MILPNGFRQWKKTMRHNSRLDAVEESLTPKQVIFEWFEEVRNFESFREYSAWVAERFETDQPIDPPSMRIEAFIRKRFKGANSEEIQSALRSAVREVSFLYSLCLLMNNEIESQDRPLMVHGTLCVECANFAFREEDCPTGVNQFSKYRKYFYSYATEVFRLKAAVEDLQEKFFDGHLILWKSQAKQLDQHVKQVNRLAVWWEDHFLNLEVKKGTPEKTIVDIPFEFDLEAIEKSIDPVEWTKSIIGAARSEALEEVGEHDAALDFIQPSLRQKGRKGRNNRNTDVTRG
jgi:hypothetical protein